MDSIINEQEYDVVLDILQKHHDNLMKITERNMQSEGLGLGIMDDIRLDQCEQLKRAMRLWKATTKGVGYRE